MISFVKIGSYYFNLAHIESIQPDTPNYQKTRVYTQKREYLCEIHFDDAVDRILEGVEELKNPLESDD